MLVRTKFH